jgi:signal transduction histidine kinase
VLTGNPLTGYGISNLELLLLLLGLLAVVGVAFGLLWRRWHQEVRRSELALVAAQQRAERLHHEVEQARARYDPAEIKRLLEQSQAEIAHRFGSRLFDIAERCRETERRVRPDQPDVRIAINGMAAVALEMLHASRVSVGIAGLSHRMPVWETLRPRRVLEGLIKDLLHYAESRSVRILTDYGIVCPILTDRVWLYDLCEVVIHNAIKYSPEFTGVVRIALRPDDSGERIIIDAQDNGPGIKPEDQGRIFALYARGDGQRAPGGGLGLAYAKALATKSGGELLLVESRPNEGSLFRIILPCAGPAEASRPDGAGEGDAT